MLKTLWWIWRLGRDGGETKYLVGVREKNCTFWVENCSKGPMGGSRLPIRKLLSCSRWDNKTVLSPRDRAAFHRTKRVPFFKHVSRVLARVGCGPRKLSWEVTRPLKCVSLTRPRKLTWVQGSAFVSTRERGRGPSVDPHWRLAKAPGHPSLAGVNTGSTTVMRGPHQGPGGKQNSIQVTRS